MQFYRQWVVKQPLTSQKQRILGIWEKYNVRLIGVDIKAIDKAEDREKFRQWMIELQVPVATAKTANSF